MLEDALYSFDSPKSIKVSFGVGSVSINTDYMAKMKFLFNEASIYPSQTTRETVLTALSLVRDKLASMNSEISINNSSLQYFVITFLDPNGEYYSKENLVYLESSLTDLAEDIDLWLDQIAAKEAKKQMAIAEEINLMAIETEDIQQAAQEFLSQNRNETTLEETRYFINAGRCLRHCYDDWLYQIIQDDAVADVFYLHTRDTATIKGKFIIQCIEHGDSKRAGELVDRMIATAAYPDYAQKWGYPWESDSLNTMKNVLRYYFPDAESKRNNNLTEHVAVAVSLSERIMQHLSKHTKKGILGYLALTAPRQKYVMEYIATLIDDVEHYAQIRRPRGWGNQVNRISSEIIESFSVLEALGEVSIIARILHVLKAAGPALEPINYDRWIEMCESRVSERTFMLIKNDDFHIYSRLTHPCRECVPKDVTTERWKQNRIPLSGQKHFIITVSCDTAEGFVQCSLMLWIAEAIHENEVRITINCSGTVYAVLLLVLPFFKKRFFHEVQHWNFPNTVDCLWCMNVTITAIRLMKVWALSVPRLLTTGRFVSSISTTM